MYNHEKKLLIWEDDICWCEQLGNCLKKEKIGVAEVNDSVEFTERLTRLDKYFAALISKEQLTELTAESESFDRHSQKEVLKKLCQMAKLPIILVCDAANDAEEIDAIDAGAADYLDKEKSMPVILARLLRYDKKEEIISHTNTDYPDIWETEEKRKITIGKTPVFLSPKEGKLMHCLLHSKREMCTRRELIDAAWDNDTPEDSRVLDTAIWQLRAKLKENGYTISSGYHLGYILCKIQ